MPDNNPYHDGELTIQAQTGEQLMAERNGRAVNTAIMPGALKFIAQQPMAVFGSLDESKNPWASIVIGHPGFAEAHNPHEVMFDFTNAGSHEHDPLWRNLHQDPRVGTLFIELSSRRRLRINGRVTRMNPQNLCLNVVEVYPNCPKYIQRRHLKIKPTIDQVIVDSESDTGTSLTTRQQQWIEHSDTFFVASAHPQGQADVSHRGGEPGFVRVMDDRTLRIPDYAGNSMYNTLGNFQTNPRAGLAFINFQSGQIIQMTGRPAILWNQDEHPEQTTGGTGRYWHFTVTQWLEGSLSLWAGAEFLDRWDGNPSSQGS